MLSSRSRVREAYLLERTAAIPPFGSLLPEPVAWCRIRAGLLTAGGTWPSRFRDTDMEAASLR